MNDDFDRPLKHAKHAWIIVIAIILGVWGADSLLNPDGHDNNEPYTGLCSGPTTQGGC